MGGGVVVVEDEDDSIVSPGFDVEADSFSVLEDFEPALRDTCFHKCLTDHFEVLITWLPWLDSFLVEFPQSCSSTLLCKSRDLRAPNFLLRQLAKLWLDLTLLERHFQIHPRAAGSRA